MKKIKKAVATLGVAAALAGTVGTAGQVATADLSSKAQAYTTSSCYWTRLNGISYGQMVYSCYYDYSWAEELFQGKRDGRYYTVPVLYT